MWILKIIKGNNFNYYIAPYKIILKYIFDNYEVIKINDYNLKTNDNKIRFEIYLGEKLNVKQENNTLQYRKHR